MSSPQSKLRRLLLFALGFALLLGTNFYYQQNVEAEGTGLKAEYFSDTNLKNLVTTRTDSTVNFDWQYKAPITGVPADRFSARWSGYVTPRFSENYRFSTITDDGIRLWVNGQMLIDNWSDHAVKEDWGWINLVAGQKYEIKMEFYENGGQAVAILMWLSVHQPKEVIPQSQLSTNQTVTPVLSGTGGTISGLNIRNWDAATNTWKTSGDWYNCDGSIDNDRNHHTMDQNDKDPAHNLGKYCDGTKEAYRSNLNNVSATLQESKPAVSPPTSNPSPAPVLTVNNTNNPFANTKLYVNSNNDPANYVRTNQGSYNAQLMDKIARQPEVVWLGGWNSNITRDVSNFMDSHTNQTALPVFVVYNIPNRDCGGYSSGGVTDSNSYRNWISQIASTIGNRKAVVILEPDAVTLTDCLNSQQKHERNQMLKEAIQSFKSQGNISVYVDAGHPNWHSATEMANRLQAVGISSADGFALNVANFYTNEQNAQFGKQISDIIGGKHFIVDTGRNGSGATQDAQWCNPSGRSLGTPPTTNTGNQLIDAYLWVKGPGGSDGNCNGGPSAGPFWPEYALDLTRRTNW